MTSPRRVLIAGAGTGAHWNVGDAAILAAMVRPLRGIGANLRPTVVSANPPGTLAPWDVDEVRFDSIPDLLAAAEESSLLLLGGGGLFFDYWDFPAGELLTPAHAGLSFYAGFAMLATLLRKPLMVYAAGVGPLRTDAGRHLTRTAFEQAGAITVRDPESAALLDEIGIAAERVTVTADPAFLMEPAPADRAEQILTSAAGRPVEAPRLAVSVRRWTLGPPSERWEAGLAGALDAFLDRHGGTALFIPFHRAVGDEDDEAAAASIIGRMRHGGRAVALGSGLLPEEVSAVIGRCDLLVGMRLHAHLFAQTHGVPSVAIVYDPKVRSAMGGFLERFAVSLDELIGERPGALLDEVLARRDELSAEIRGQRQLRVAAASSNAAIAAELLGRGPEERDHSRATGRTIEQLALRQLRRTVELESTIHRMEAEALQRQEGIEWLRSEVRLRDDRIAELLRASRESR